MPAAAQAWRTDRCNDSRACISPTRTMLLGPARRDGQQVGFIAYGAGGLGTAAVDAEIVGHEIIFSTEQLPVGVSCRRGLQSLTRGKPRLLR